jgi:hypothetical protein
MAMRALGELRQPQLNQPGSRVAILLDVMSAGCQVGGPPFRAIEIARVARADRAEPHARRADHEEV